MIKLELLNISEIRQLIVTKQITVKEVVTYFIERIKKYGLLDSSNAVKYINPSAIKEASALDKKIAQGLSLPLLGIPYIVKDNIDVKGMVTSAGSVFLVDNVAKKDSEVVRKLKKAGAICIGKANMMELANYIGSLPDGYSSYGGKVYNAYSKDYPAGGSSTGSAVAMTLGLAPFTLGTDTSYSVVGCAGLNGVIGFKPSALNISAKGVVPITKYLDAVGVFTKNISDLDLVLSVILKKYEPQETPLKMSLGIDGCRENELSDAFKKSLYDFVIKLENMGFNTQKTIYPNQDYIYELMKRDYANSFNAYLKDANSNIHTFEELYNAYKSNSYANQYGIHILEKALDFSCEENNNQRIKDILTTIKKEKKSFLKLFDHFDAVIETGSTSCIHVFNVPALSFPFTKGLNGVPQNIVIYAYDEQTLIKVAYLVEKLIETNLITDILKQYK